MLKLEKMKDEPGRRVFTYKGMHYGKMVLDFDLTISHNENDTDGKFRVEGIDFGNDMYAASVDEALEILRSRLERAAAVLGAAKAGTVVPLFYKKEEK